MLLDRIIPELNFKKVKLVLIQCSSLRNGLVASGLLRGFAMYKSNNVKDSAGNASVLFGHMRSTSCANAMNTVESFRSPTTFADQVRGLHVYGRKVLDKLSVGAGIITVT